MLSSLINQHDIRDLKYSIISGDKDERKSQSIDIIKNLI